MKLRVLHFGRGPSWLEEAVDEYAKRMPELSVERIRDNPQRSKFERMLRTTERSTTVMLDSRGRQFSTEDLATRLRDWQMDGSNVCFLIGDSDGFTDNQRSNADLMWSLSSLTFPYSIARLIVCEQLYRARSIVNGHPYHRRES